ncbi:hypothetical protein [Gordonia sp. VNK21]|uniref:hypothetical protein n=1 Tax=Gordonia sp. VNK21 TaxID=3382483 RepID=UPI0038D4E4B9
MSVRSRVLGRLEAPMTPAGAAVRLAAAGLLVAAGLAALILVQLWRAPVAERIDTGDELRAQAGIVISEVFSADAGSWQADRARARTLVGGPLQTSMAEALGAPVPAGVSAVRWQPLAVGVVDEQADSGTAVIVVRVLVIPESGQSTESIKSVNADFARSDGRWVLTGMDELQ